MRKEESTTKAYEEAENEIFDDFFDQQNDFFAASSTVSPVVFKGSPGPGFFSSPRPFFDNNGKVGKSHWILNTDNIFYAHEIVSHLAK